MSPLNKLLNKFQSTTALKRAVVVYETVSVPTKEWKTVLAEAQSLPGDCFVFVDQSPAAIISITDTVAMLEPYTSNIFTTSNIQANLQQLIDEGYNHITLLSPFKYSHSSVVIENKPTNILSKEQKLIEYLKEGDKRFITECLDRSSAKVIGERFIASSQPSLREKYINGDIFKNGTLVESIKTGKQYRVLERCTNYIRAATSDGEVEKVWIRDLKQIDEQVGDIQLPNLHQISFYGYNTTSFTKTHKRLFESLLHADDQFAVFSAIKHTDLFYQSLDLVEKNTHFEKSKKFLEKLGVLEQHQYRDDMELQLAEAAIKNIPDIVKITKNDKIKTAQIIAAACGVKDTSGTPEEIVDRAAQAVKKDKPDGDVLPIYGSMFDLANAVGILWNRDIFSNSQLQQMGLIESLTVERINQFVELVVESSLSFSDVVYVYEPAELVIVESTGNIIPLDDIEGESTADKASNAVKTKVGQPERKIAVREPSTQKDMSRRAKNLMLKYLKARREKSLFSDKERQQLENILNTKGSTITTGAIKLLKKLQQIEAERLVQSETPQ